MSAEIRVPAERLTALIEELALAVERCREYGAPIQATRVVVSALNLAQNLTDGGQATGLVGARNRAALGEQQAGEDGADGEVAR